LSDPAPSVHHPNNPVLGQNRPPGVSLLG
jgi:hypothetical protein